MKYFKFAVLFSGAFFLKGCGFLFDCVACDDSSVSGVNNVTQKYAILQTPGVTIRSGKWEMKPGEPVEPPYIHDSSYTERGSYDWMGDYVVEDRRNGALWAEHLSVDYKAYLKRFGAWDSAIKVTVELDDGKKFNGIMVFATAREDVQDSSAKRAWSVQVPRSYVNIASSGQIAMLYQPAQLSSGDDIITWALWMSSLPM